MKMYVLSARVATSAPSYGRDLRMHADVLKFGSPRVRCLLDRSRCMRVGVFNDVSASPFCRLVASLLVDSARAAECSA